MDSEIKAAIQSAEQYRKWQHNYDNAIGRAERLTKAQAEVVVLSAEVIRLRNLLGLKEDSP